MSEAQNAAPPADPAPRRRLPLIILAVVVVIAAIGAGYLWYTGRNVLDTDDAFTDGHAVVIAPHVSGYVVVLGVRDNQFVHRGDVLIQIDPRDYQAARDQAAAALAVAQAQLDAATLRQQMAMVQYPARRDVAQAQLAASSAQLVRTKADARRQNSLPAAATARQEVDVADAALRQAQAQRDQMQAQLQEASLVPQNIGLAEADVHQLQGQVDQARAQLAQATLNLGWTHVLAPQDGWVTKRNVEQGNLVQSGTEIMNLVTPEIWVTANFKETELARLRIGQSVEVDVDAYPKLRLHGHVDSLQMGTGAKFSAFPAENATGNYVKIVQRVPVKIDIDSGLDPNFPLPLGLSVTPRVALK